MQSGEVGVSFFFSSSFNPIISSSLFFLIHLDTSSVSSSTSSSSSSFSVSISFFSSPSSCAQLAYSSGYDDPSIMQVEEEAGRVSFRVAADNYHQMKR
ncbi:hypothetical protein Pcinc_038164 [Petrolisthes cinctipes]|uniref:Uncharacterized protein n=1 Tax=Petrolisthes cinctipes TaxID=88211 RepID=A0AAE1EKB9_PETCI|nr:hypothetical protein Pcinc_038164 [Petrolisthes cinctipes]